MAIMKLCLFSAAVCVTLCDADDPVIQPGDPLCEGICNSIENTPGFQPAPNNCDCGTSICDMICRSIDTIPGYVPPVPYCDCGGPSCFPGDARVTSSGTLATYEGTLGFLHKLQGPSTFLAIAHEAGEFRASAQHLVFNGRSGRAMAVALFKPGDHLILSSGAYSRILSITKDTTEHGMFAPLTASGTIDVDAVKASNYATVGKLDIPHAAMHASFVVSRLFPGLQAIGAAETETVNPLAYIFHSVLKLDKLL